MRRTTGVVASGTFVVTTAVRDVVWRGRRWTIAAVGTALALSVSLLLAGFLASFDAEVRTSLDALGGDGYVVREGAAGPFTTPSPVGADRLAEVQAVPGIAAVTPIVTLPYTLRGQPGSSDIDEVVDVFLVGMDADAVDAWPLQAGRPIREPGEVVLDRRAGAEVGDRVTMGDRSFVVVGTTKDVHVLAGKGLAWTSLADAQTLLFGGAPLVSGFRYEGTPDGAPPQLALVDADAARADLVRLVRPIIQSIETFRLLMWIVAAAVVGSVLYLTAVDRVRDFAVFKATGARNRDLSASLLLQAAVLALVSSVAAIGIAFLLAPTFPTPVLFTPRLLLFAPVLAIAIGAVGSLAGVRRAMSTDPALAFGGS